MDGGDNAEDDEKSEGISGLESDGELDNFDEDEEYDRSIWALSGGSPSGELHFYLSPNTSRVSIGLNNYLFPARNILICQIVTKSFNICSKFNIFVVCLGSLILLVSSNQVVVKIIN